MPPYSDAEWIGPLVRKEIARMNAETKAQFDRTVATIERLEDETTIRWLLRDVFGHRAYEITVERG